jgi:hypothetical protein
MKNRLLNLSLVLAAVAAVSLTGCASYRGLVPYKDVHIKNFKHEITTPWGHHIITADELDTTVKPEGGSK